LHVEDPLTGGRQLLGEQVAQPAGSFYGEGPLREAAGPVEQPLELGGTSTDPQLAEGGLGLIDRRRRVGSLCGSIPIITVTRPSPFAVLG